VFPAGGLVRRFCTGAKGVKFQGEKEHSKWFSWHEGAHRGGGRERGGLNVTMGYANGLAKRASHDASGKKHQRGRGRERIQWKSETKGTTR